VYIVRDPRDVAVSLANHLSVSIDHAIARMAKVNAIMGTGTKKLTIQLPQHLSSWSAHVESWCSAPISRVVIRYEDMQSEPVVAFSKIADFLGVDSPLDKVKAAVNAVQFNRLQAAEKKDGFIESPSPKTQFFRRGVAGGWRDTLNLKQVKLIEAEHGSVMRSLGYVIE
jgi:aryl sulfotransferase